MFWEGFMKAAAGTRVGVKAVQPPSASGKMVGNKPTSMVSTAAAYKPNPLPTPTPHDAKDISSTKLPSSGKLP